MSLVLSTETLRQVFSTLIDRVERDFGTEIDLQSQPKHLAEYWKVELEEAYTCADEVTRSAGDVREDRDEIVELLSRHENDVNLWHDLDHLAGLLRALAYLDLPVSRR